MRRARRHPKLPTVPTLPRRKGGKEERRRGGEVHPLTFPMRLHKTNQTGRRRAGRREEGSGVRLAHAFMPFRTVPPYSFIYFLRAYRFCSESGKSQLGRHGDECKWVRKKGLLDWRSARPRST